MTFQVVQNQQQPPPKHPQPDVREGLLTLRDATEADAAFVDRLTRETMTPYVQQTWQDLSEVAYYFLKNKFTQVGTRIVQFNGRDVGRLTLIHSHDEIFVDNIHVHPDFQGRGIGAAVLRQVISEARRDGRAVRLQCLRVNPAEHLHRRLGFLELDRNATHFFLRLPSRAPTRSPVIRVPRPHDPGPRELAALHPGVPFFILLKMDLQRRGLLLTPAALDAVQDPLYDYGRSYVIYGQGDQARKNAPGPLLLRDGTSVLVLAGAQYNESYTVDYRDGRFLLYDGDEFIDEVDFTPRPDYYGKLTSNGVPMETIATARPQRLDINPYRYCHFWDGGNQCRYCAYFTDVKASSTLANGKFPRQVDPQDIYETVREALKEPGRFSQVMLTSGADPRGENTFDFEVDRQIEALQAIGRNFKTRRFASQLIGCGYDKAQLQRLHDETGLTTYCPDIEVWDPKLFDWICPGKAKWNGRDWWIRSALDAVDIFGPGNVYTNAVAGVEMAQPHGFKTVDEALASHFEACEFFAKNGVIYLSLVWIPWRGSQFHGQKQPPLEFYARLVKGLHDIRKAYGLKANNDDYRHCGNHGDSDLERLD